MRRKRYCAGLNLKMGKDIKFHKRGKVRDVYEKASEYALGRGVIIADTKFEFGPGKAQVSFNKQFARDYLENIDWNKAPPAPQIPTEIIEKTSLKYLEAYQRITGKTLQGIDENI